MSAPAREPIPSLEVDPALAPSPAPAAPAHRSGRWIDHWDPEDPTFWRGGGRRVARRNLTLSVFAEFLGFCVWALWSVVVTAAAGGRVRPDPRPAVLADRGAEPRRRDAADPLHVRRAEVRRPQLDHRLRAAAARPGRRRWPWSCSTRARRFGVLLACAALAGVGGGNFASLDDQHLVLLPRGGEGQGARPQRRRRQPRHGASCSWSCRSSSSSAPASTSSGPGSMFIPLVLLAAVLAWRVHGQPVRRQGRLPQPRAWPPATGTPGSSRSSTSAPSARSSATRAPSRRCSRPSSPRSPRSIAFLGALVGSLARPLGGMARRPVRRRPGHASARSSLMGVGVRRRDRRLQAHSFAALPRLVPGAVRRRRHRQRLDVPDDPRGLPRRRSTGRAARPRAAQGRGRVHRHRRGGRRVRRVPHPARVRDRPRRPSARSSRPVGASSWLYLLHGAPSRTSCYQRRGAALAAETI